MAMSSRRGEPTADIRKSIYINALSKTVDCSNQPPPGRWTFVILEPSSPEIAWCGKIVSEQMMMVYLLGSYSGAARLPGFRVLKLSFPIAMVEEWNDLNQIDGGRVLK